MSSSEPVLTYFNGKGRAESIRVILSEAGVSFKDVRVDNISNIKSDLAFGQVPLLEIDGHKLVQSVAISRYLARKYGLYGKSDYDGYVADMIVDGLEDLNSARRNAKTDEEKTKFTGETLPKWLDYFEKLLKSSGGDYFASVFTYADILVYLTTSFLSNTYAGCLDSYPSLIAHRDRIASRPKIAEWIKKRPQTAW